MNDLQFVYEFVIVRSCNNEAFDEEDTERAGKGPTIDCPTLRSYTTTVERF